MTVKPYFTLFSAVVGTEFNRHNCFVKIGLTNTSKYSEEKPENACIWGFTTGFPGRAVPPVSKQCK